MADIQAATDGIIAATSHPVTVQVINQGPGIWGNVATGLITAGAAIAAVMLTHRFTLRREMLASENKMQLERHFISTELIFLLEQYAEGCASVAADAGDDHSQAECEPTVSYPELSITGVAGDWRVLPSLLMYRIRQLPVMQNEALRVISGVGEYDYPPDYSSYFRERQYQFARLGMKSVILAMRLRKSASLPESRLQDTEWSAYNVLWKVWRRERKRRTAEYVQNRAWHEQELLQNNSEETSL